jgi:hypothetical protein
LVSLGAKVWNFNKINDTAATDMNSKKKIHSFTECLTDKIKSLPFTSNI